jgi:hypothetical protein
MQDSPTSVTAPHASLRHKKGEADEGGPQWGGCHDAPLTQAPRPSYEMRPSPSRDLLWGLQNSPSRAQLQAPRFRTDRWGDQTPLPPHQATTLTSRSDQAMGGQRPAFVEKFATAPPIPSHAYCASDLPRQVRRLGHPTLAAAPHPPPLATAPHPTPCHRTPPHPLPNCASPVLRRHSLASSTAAWCGCSSAATR